MPGPITRFYVEDTTIRRCRGIMALAKLTVTAISGTPNPDMSDPIATALEELGVPPLDRSNVVDADIAILSPAIQARFLDLVEVRTLETSLQQILSFPQTIAWSDYRKTNGMSATDLQNFIAAKWQRYLDRWAHAGTLSIGTMCPQTQNILQPWPINTGYPGFYQP